MGRIWELESCLILAQWRPPLWLRQVTHFFPISQAVLCELNGCDGRTLKSDGSPEEIPSPPLSCRTADGGALGPEVGSGTVWILLLTHTVNVLVL